MSGSPRCIIVTGRPGAGKTTLAKKLGERLWLPVISRDEIKEGYVNTFGVAHDRLPAEANAAVSDLFFDIVLKYLAGKVSVIAEAAFQHAVWAARIAAIAGHGRPFLIVCAIDPETAARRHLERGLAAPERLFYHGDRRVSVYRETGEMGAPGPYEAPELDVPTIRVATDGEYAPGIDEIAEWIRLEDAGHDGGGEPAR